MLEKAATPLIARLISSGDTAGAGQLTTQLKAKMAGEAVPTPHASATLLFAQYDQARAKALEPAQKAGISRIDAMLKPAAGSPKLELVTELGKVREEIEGASASPAAVAANDFPMHWSYHLKPERLVDNGYIDMKTDGTLVIGNANDSSGGRWSTTSKPNVLSVFLEGEKGGENCEMRINGKEAELVRPIGTRYLKAR